MLAEGRRTYTVKIQKDEIMSDEEYKEINEMLMKEDIWKIRDFIDEKVQPQIPYKKKKDYGFRIYEHNGSYGMIITFYLQIMDFIHIN